jgi:hypothetical protein
LFERIASEQIHLQSYWKDGIPIGTFERKVVVAAAVEACWKPPHGGLASKQ